MPGIAAVEGVLIVLVSVGLWRGGRGPDGYAAPRAQPAAAPRVLDEAAAAPSMEAALPVEAPALAVTGSTREATATRSAMLFGHVSGGSRNGWLVVERESGERVTRIAFQKDAQDYAVPGLLPGRYRVKAWAPGKRPIEAELEVPPGVGRIQRDFRLETSWQLKVELATPEGKPLLEGLRPRPPLDRWFEPVVFASRDAPPAFLPFLDGRNAFVGFGRWVGGNQVFGGDTRLPKPYAGYLDLPEQCPLHVSVALGSAVLATESVAAGQEAVKLTVALDRLQGALCTLRLQVVEGASDRPVPDARVSIGWAGSSGPERRTDAEGRVELKSLVAGEFNLGIEGTKTGGVTFTVVLAPGAVVDLGAVRVFPAVSVVLRFSGVAAGTEINGSLTSRTPPAHSALRAFKLPLHHGMWQNGVWSASVPAGRYHLRAIGGGAGALLEVEARPDAEPIVVPMQPEAKLRVVPPGGGRLVELAIAGASGSDLYRRWITWPGAFDVSLPPGAYTAQIMRVDGHSERRAVQVPLAGATLDLRL